MEERFSLKDHLFNEESVGYLASLLADAEQGFPAEDFIARVVAPLPGLELKERITHIAEVLAEFLPPVYSDAAALIRRALPSPLDPTLSDGDFGDFIIAPLGEFVATCGLEPGDYETSISLLLDITQRFSMEGPIRAFIQSYPVETMSILGKWAHHPNYHVRRLVSEGTRPLLPWAPRIQIPPASTIPLLDVLHADSTRYVTRSVANHLNDLSKIDPGLVIETLGRWRLWGRQRDAELAWMTKHSMRTLVKKGHPGAMEFLGFSANPKVEVGPIEVTAPLPVMAGQALEFRFPITARHREPLIVDYLIEFANENRAPRSKVFKLKQVLLEAGNTVVLSKSHRFRAGASTFTLYPGTHRLTIQVNGNATASTEFQLVTE